MKQILVVITMMMGKMIRKDKQMKFRTVILLCALAGFSPISADESVTSIQAAERDYMQACLASGEDVMVCDCSRASLKAAIEADDYSVLIAFMAALGRQDAEAAQAILSKAGLDMQTDPEATVKVQSWLVLLQNAQQFCKPDLPQPMGR